MLTRRQTAQLLVSAVLASCTGKRPDHTGRSVLIVGAGIIGASIGYHLAKAGAQVTVIDENAPASGASRGTFAWINATWAKQPQHYHAFSQSSVASWKDWQSSLGIPVKWGGSLEWFSGPKRQARLAADIEEQVLWGEPAKMVSGQTLRALEPKMQFRNDQLAAYSPNDGAVDPVAATQTLLSQAQSLGGQLIYPCALKQIEPAKQGVKAITTCGDMTVDTLVLATGAAPNAAMDFAKMPLPQRTTPGIICITKPLPPLLGRIISGPGFHIHQRLDGRCVIGEQDGAPENDAHKLRLKGRPAQFPDRIFAEQHFERMVAPIKPFLPAIEAAALDDAFIGWRPLPLDGHPVLGRASQMRNVYLAIMHSGVSLAPIVGQLVCQDIADNQQQSILAPYRPDRAFEQIKRY